ncbi:hypothetical protein OSTOST_19171 [Ostertagia ostertagi]
MMEHETLTIAGISYKQTRRIMSAEGMNPLLTVTRPTPAGLLRQQTNMKVIYGGYVKHFTNR